MSVDDGFLSDDGVNDDGRGHNVDDHDNRDDFYHLHGDEGNIEIGDQSGDSHGSCGSIGHSYICLGNDESHGHNYDDHDLKKSDDDEKDNRDGEMKEVDIHHGNCKDHASY